MSKVAKYKNRYGDYYTFTKQEDGNVLMEGKFEWMRAGGDFIDPSGGPYLGEHTDLGEFLSDEFDGLCIRSFEPIETGYKINTYGKFDYLED